MARKISLMYKAPKGFFKKPKAKKNRNRSLIGDVAGITRAGVGIGIGTGIVSGAEGVAGVSSGVLPALGTAGSMLSPVATATLGGHAISRLRDIESASRRRKRSRGPEQYGFD